LNWFTSFVTSSIQVFCIRVLPSRMGCIRWKACGKTGWLVVRKEA
jgi:hypothetical protein